MAAVQLTPAADRPYVGGSTNNSELNLIFGYNGFGRLSGNETGSVGRARRRAGNMWGPTGWDRLFLTSIGGQISWLIPGALIGLVAVLWLTRRAPRTDRTRAGFLLFGGWLLLTGAVFSFAQGIIHPYYTVALAPAVGALVGMGASTLWRRRRAALPPAGPGRGHPGQHRLGLRHPRLEPHLVSGTALGRSWPSGVVAALGIALVPRARGVLAAGHRRPRHRLGHRRPGRLLARHGVHPPQRSHPLGRARPSTSGGGFGGGLRRSRSDSRGFARNGITLPKGFTLPNGANCPTASPSRRASSGTASPGSGRIRCGGGGGAAARWRIRRRTAAPGGPDLPAVPAGRRCRRWSGRRRRWRCRRTAQRLDAGQAAGAVAQRRRLPVLVGGRHHRIELGVRLPAGHRRPGHGHRRLQRHRPDAHPGPVREVRGRGEDPLLHRRWRRLGGGWVRRWIRRLGDVAASQIESWVSTHYHGPTVDGVTVYDLTAPVTGSAGATGTATGT